MSLHFFELKKLPANELTASNKLLLWLSLFKADTEEELAQIKALKEPVMEQAINAYETITVDPEFRERDKELLALIDKGYTVEDIRRELLTKPQEQ